MVTTGLRFTEGEEWEVQVAAHGGTKCPRCWNRRGGAGAGDDLDLCPRCWDVVQAERVE